MDLQYLLALQGLRESLPSPVETFFVLLSFIGEGPGLAFIALVVYWCIDKRAGQLSFISFAVATYVGQFLKNIVCVYRPWIRNPNIVPAEAALEGATGYSFPSGHVTGTTSTLGALAWYARRKRKAITIICIVVILLMAFARNFLGLHTPQDVLAALAIALVSIALTQMFLNWIERYDALMPGHNKDILAMVIALVLCVVALVVMIVKPYPMDYANGQLIVDPIAMQKSAFEAVGVLAGLSIAWVLERRLVSFSTEGLPMRSRIIRFVIGVAVVGIIYVVSDIAFKAVLPYNWAKLLAMGLVAFTGMFLAPFVFDKVERRKAR